MKLLDNLFTKRKVLYFADNAHPYSVLNMIINDHKLLGKDLYQIYPFIANLQGERIIERFRKIKPVHIFKEGIYS